MQLSFMYRNVIENIKVSDGVFKLTVDGRYDVNPGQFFMIRCWGEEPLLSRPISVHDAGHDFTSFLYQVKGRGTDIISNLKKGDGVNLLGPLGKGFDVEGIKGRIAVVAGGIGIAPMLYTLKSIKDSEIDLYAGFRNNVYMLNEIKEYAANIYIATEDGNLGYRGYVTEIFSPVDYNAVLCCGPEIMMKKVVKACRECATPVYISMESNMACGVGTCLGCTCETVNGNRRVCKDGPVFSGREVVSGA